MSGKVSADELHRAYYERYSGELGNLWRNSSFAWGFEALLFAAYGQIILKKLEENCPSFDILLAIVAFLGLCISLIWIALAKASKIWQEWYENRITSFERNRMYFDFPRRYAMGGTSNKVENVDSSFRTTDPGKFSPGRLNIFIAQVVWCVWFLAIVFQLVIIPLYHDSVPDFIAILVFAFAYFIFRYELSNKCGNGYIEKEDYGKEYIYQTYIEIEEAEKILPQIMSWELNDYFLNVYAPISNPLFKILSEDMDVADWEDWVEKPYEQLLNEFKDEYIKSESGINSAAAIKYIDRIQNVFKSYKDKLRDIYEQD